MEDVEEPTPWKWPLKPEPWNVIVGLGVGDGADERGKGVGWDGWMGRPPSCSHPRNVLGVQRKIPVSTDSRVSRGGEERDEGRRTKEEEEEEDDDDDDDNDKEEEEERAWLRPRCQLPLINEILCTLTSLSPLHVETRPSTCREAINLDATGVFDYVQQGFMRWRVGPGRRQFA